MIINKVIKLLSLLHISIFNTISGYSAKQTKQTNTNL